MKYWVFIILGTLLLALGSVTSFADAQVESINENLRVIARNKTDLKKYLVQDSDQDGLPDAIEIQLGLNPNKVDSYGGGRPDNLGDQNGNGQIDLDEYQRGVFDTDSDGLSDSDEVRLGLDPFLPNFLDSALADGDVLAKFANDSESNPLDRLLQFKRKVAAKLVCKKGFASKKICSNKCKQIRGRKVCKKVCVNKCVKVVIVPTPAPSATPGDSPTSVPTPTSTPIPTPTSTPSSNFDSNGNTTKFGIPPGLVGNISRGTSVWDTNCKRCHGSDKVNRSYSRIKSALLLPVMASVKVSDPEVADAVAYLNRLQQP